MVSRAVYTVFILALGIQRLVELVISRKNEKRIRAAGGSEYGAGHFKIMAGIHTVWLAASLGEVYLLNRPFIPWLGIPSLVVFLLGQGLRYSAILALGWRWSVRVMVIPGRPPVERGIYRYLRHPNYLGVILEMFSAPLIHSAVISAVIFGIANMLLLKTRIRVEEAALTRQKASSSWLESRPRFIPSLRTPDLKDE